MRLRSSCRPLELRPWTCSPGRGYGGAGWHNEVHGGRGEAEAPEEEVETHQVGDESRTPSSSPLRPSKVRDLWGAAASLVSEGD